MTLLFLLFIFQCFGKDEIEVCYITDMAHDTNGSIPTNMFDCVHGLVYEYPTNSTGEKGEKYKYCYHYFSKDHENGTFCSPYRWTFAGTDMGVNAVRFIEEEMTMEELKEEIKILAFAYMDEENNDKFSDLDGTPRFPSYFDEVQTEYEGKPIWVKNV